MQRVIFDNNVAPALAEVVGAMRPASVHLLADANVAPLAAELLPGAGRIVIPAGDGAKTLATAETVWRALGDAGATRGSVLVNVGGGMVTDLGGFAAATFKRGIRFVNVPTTLLGAVDAAVGGKTGVNFGGLKNEIGVFRPAEAVVISTRFFATLPQEELLSGFAEMIKHALLDSPQLLAATLGHDFADNAALLPLLRRSVEIKQEIVSRDPREKGLRRALNLGHTAGHAFEELALGRKRPVPHGFAVAWGLVVELALSTMIAGLKSDVLYGVARFVRNHYGHPQISCHDYPELIALMRHDKKNDDPSRINFTLISAPGQAILDNIADEATIQAALDIFRDLCE